MTKKMKKSSTNKLTLWYNNDTSYTIPRVEYFSVARDGKSVTGCYNKTVTFHGITEERKVTFTIKLDDVVSMYYDAKHGTVSKNFLVDDGQISTVTEYRTEDDYYSPLSAEEVLQLEMGVGKLLDLYNTSPRDAGIECGMMIQNIIQSV
ncbi:hypothetical protein NVP1161O_134 [Vibrio phage 1.161.O._10N.261.48.C5]|nr:hypothetical protein NVP1161O_134 [Vibrio phage 1.161.O._10N.261.48.C5]